MKLTACKKPAGPLEPLEPGPDADHVLPRGHLIRGYHDENGQYYEHDETADRWYRLDQS